MTSGKFLIDEDLPRALAPALRVAGFEVDDVRDVGLRGKHDEDIFRFSLANGHLILTADRGFANPTRFAFAEHPGIVVANFANEVSAPEVVRLIVQLLATVSVAELRGHITILEPGRLRTRPLP